MKKTLILAAVAAVALSACSKNEIIETINKVPENQMVGFSSYTPKAITKADANYYVDGTTATNLVSGKTFGVYSWAITNTSTTPWSDGKLFDGTGTPNFMSNIPVTFKGDAAGVDSDGSANVSAPGYYSDGNPVRYWPAGDTPDGLSFFAYYPAGAAGLTLPANGLGATTFVTRDTPAAQIDLMVSDVVADQYYGHTNSAFSSGTRGTVDLHFHHTLTKVQFKFKTDLTDANTTVKLTNAQLTGVYNTNTLTTGYTKGATANAGTTAYNWGTATNPVGYDITVNGSTPASSNVTLTTDATTLTAADAFLMVPQTIAASQQKITLTWTVTTAGYTTTNTKVIDLNDITNSGAHIDWAKNAQVTYTITIGPKPIYFTATVDGWAAETNGTISVN